MTRILAVETSGDYASAALLADGEVVCNIFKEKNRHTESLISLADEVLCGKNLKVADMDAVAWVETAPDDGTHFFAQERPAYYQTVAGKRPVGRLHRVTVSGLEPGTVYRYRVMQQAVLTPPGEKRIVFGIASGNNPFRQQPYEVRTLDPDAETLDFAIINDIHGKDQVFRKLMADIPSDSIDTMETCFPQWIPKSSCSTVT